MCFPIFWTVVYSSELSLFLEFVGCNIVKIHQPAECRLFVCSFIIFVC